MDSKIDVVKLQAKKVGKHSQYFMTVPKSFVEELGLEKGIPLIVRIMDVEINGAKKRGMFVYKP